MWKYNLFQNLLVIFILFTIFVILYTKVKDITIVEFARQMRDIFTGNYKK